MPIKSKCLKRLILWIVCTVLSIVLGLLLDLLFFKTKSFHISFRIIGLIGIMLSHFLLKRTGKLLKIQGECTAWGWSSKLINHDVYKCIRHPHHIGIGFFMISLGLLIGYPFTFFTINSYQWLWIILFVLLIEEKECIEKFGDEYKLYIKKVPMFFGNPVCIVKALLKPMSKE